MQVFIENEAGSSLKKTYDESSLLLVSTAVVSSPYPFPYGFVLNTKSSDGDAVDCFVITKRILRCGTMIDGDPLGLLEQIEDGEVDHKVLCGFPDENTVLDDSVLSALRAFAAGVFSHLPNKQICAGRLLGAEAARMYVRDSTDRGII